MTGGHASPARGVMRTARVVGITLGLLCAAEVIAAQAPVGRFSVTTRLGGIRFDRAASLETSPFIGLDAEYNASRLFSIGTSVNVLRPNTRAEDFVTTVTFGVPTTGDTTSFFYTGQALSLVEA